jgi:hypothetical protein
MNVILNSAVLLIVRYKIFKFLLGFIYLVNKNNSVVLKLSNKTNEIPGSFFGVFSPTESGSASLKRLEDNDSPEADAATANGEVVAHFPLLKMKKKVKCKSKVKRYNYFYW